MDHGKNMADDALMLADELKAVLEKSEHVNEQQCYALAMVMAAKLFTAPCTGGEVCAMAVLRHCEDFLTHICTQHLGENWADMPDSILKWVYSNEEDSVSEH